MRQCLELIKPRAVFQTWDLGFKILKPGFQVQFQDIRFGMLAMQYDVALLSGIFSLSLLLAS